MSLHGHPHELLGKAKYLGLTIRQDLKWKNHVNNVYMKANITLGFLRRNLNISSTYVKEQAYNLFVRPKGEIDQLKMIQGITAKFVTNRQRNTSSVKPPFLFLRAQLIMKTYP